MVFNAWTLEVMSSDYKLFFIYQRFYPLRFSIHPLRQRQIVL